jgi:uncharacterized protein (UPF0254 family)
LYRPVICRHAVAVPSHVIATGGHAGNTQMLEAYSDPSAGTMMVRGASGAKGDGLGIGQRAGVGGGAVERDG